MCAKLMHQDSSLVLNICMLISILTGVSILTAVSIMTDNGLSQQCYVSATRSVVLVCDRTSTISYSMFFKPSLNFFFSKAIMKF